MRYSNVTGSRNVEWGHCTLNTMNTAFFSAVIPEAFGLVYINLQPEYELPSSTLLRLFGKFGKISVKGTVSQPYF